MSCGSQHTMAIIENTRYKKGQDRTVLDAYYAAHETRRQAGLKSCARMHVQRRRKQASLELEFVQSQISTSAAEFMAKTLRRVKQASVGQEGREQRKHQKHENRPVSARTASSDVPMCRLGYPSHRYRSELRQNLREAGLHQSQMPKWGEPVHFVPVPPESRSAGPTSRAGSGLSSLRQITLSPSISHADRVVSRHSDDAHAIERRPATARGPGPQSNSRQSGSQTDRGGAAPQSAAESERRKTYARPSTAQLSSAQPSRVQPASARPSTARPDQSRTQATRGSASKLWTERGFRPPPSWDNYWKK